MEALTTAPTSSYSFECSAIDMTRWEVNGRGRSLSHCHEVPLQRFFQLGNACPNACVALVKGFKIVQDDPNLLLNTGHETAIAERHTLDLKTRKDSVDLHS